MSSLLSSPVLLTHLIVVKRTDWTPLAAAPVDLAGAAARERINDLATSAVSGWLGCNWAPAAPRAAWRVLAGKLSQSLAYCVSCDLGALASLANVCCSIGPTGRAPELKR